MNIDIIPQVMPNIFFLLVKPNIQFSKKQKCSKSQTKLFWVQESKSEFSNISGWYRQNYIDIYTYVLLMLHILLYIEKITRHKNRGQSYLPEI